MYRCVCCDEDLGDDVHERSIRLCSPCFRYAGAVQSSHTSTCRLHGRSWHVDEVVPRATFANRVTT